MPYMGPRITRSLPVLAALALSLVPGRVSAAGFELTPAGARANGRGGADFVGGDSPISLFYNPANLGRTQATLSLAGAFHMHFAERCMTNVEVIENGGVRTEGTTHPEVCADGPPAIIPQLAATARISSKISLGFGIGVPTAAFRHFDMGHPRTVTIDPDGEGGNGPIPTPTRYVLVQEDVLQLFLTAGASYTPHPRVRIGASFGWGITKIGYVNVAYSRIDVLGGLITAYADARNDVVGNDSFVPRLQVGVWTQPIERVPLEIGAAFQWTAPVETGSATLRLTSLQTRIEPAAIGQLVGDLHAEGRIEGVGLRIPQTSHLAFGLRYAKRLATPVGTVGDRLATERFDIEASMVVTFQNHVDSFDVNLPDDASLVVPSPVPVILPDIEVALPDELRLEHRWRTQVALRIGGDFNPIPGVLGVRAGFTYESDGVKDGYEQIDFTPFRSFGLHFGGTVRIAKKIDLSVAFAHVFQPDVNVSVEEASYRRALGGDADPNDPAEAAIVNAGLIRQHANVLVLEAGAHF